MSARQLPYRISVLALLAATACAGAPESTPPGSTTTAAQLLETCVELQASADAMISSASGHQNYGAQPTLRTSWRYSSLLRFELGSIPPAAAITSSTLKVHVTAAQVYAGETVDFVRVKQPWSEATVTYHSFDHGYDTTLLGSITIPGANVDQSVDLTGVTQEWHAGVHPNHGVWVSTKHASETTYRSREGDPPAQRPTLTVCYTTPNTDPCSPSPCQHGGACTADGDEYVCICPVGYTGVDCEINIDDCTPNPCQNGGTCIDGVDDFSCECTPEWGGELCEDNPCDDGNPCTLDLNTADGCVSTPNASGPACQAAVQSLTSGAAHTCAIREGGSVYCWGTRDRGRLGHGSATPGHALTPVQVAGLTDAVQIDAGYEHTCAVRATGEVVCWGGNGNGQLGNGSTLEAWAPVPVEGITDAVSVAAGRTHTCVLRASGELWCFGRGIEGQLGHRANPVSALAPVKVIDDVDLAGPLGSPVPHAPLPWVEVSASEYFTCARRATGEVLCWGANGTGQLGFGATGHRNQPSLVSGLGDAVAIAAGKSHTCAVKATGHVACWGESFALGRPLPDLHVPALISGPLGPFEDAITISAHGLHTCATTAPGGTWCWGQGAGGATSIMTASPRPIAVPGPLVPTRSVATSSSECHSCALLDDGSVRCWGSFAAGSCTNQLGNGMPGGSLTPVAPLLPGA